MRSSKIVDKEAWLEKAVFKDFAVLVEVGEVLADLGLRSIPGHVIKLVPTFVVGRQYENFHLIFAIFFVMTEGRVIGKLTIPIHWEHNASRQL